MRLSGIAMLAAGALFVIPGAPVHAEAATEDGATGGAAKAVSSVGATTPFVTVEAESGSLGGGAVVRSIKPGDPAPTRASLETEASGYALVELSGTGDSVKIRNKTGKKANTLVVRASIPDAPEGGGITASLNLYVNGQFRQA
ncbi:hypothetical protein ACFU76_13150, partial [Streptomyces sp. NPDC057539]